MVAYIVLIDDSGAVIGSPFEFFAGRMDAPTLSESVNKETGEITAMITIPAESEMSDLRRTRERRYNDADQKQRFPYDRAFEFVDSLQDKTINWGKVLKAGESAPGVTYGVTAIGGLANG